MSVAYTADAVIERRKTVTRRIGWTFLKPGDTLTLCRKVQGRRRRDGTVEPLERLAEVEVLSVTREPLEWLYRDDEPGSYARDEVDAEGFPDLSPREFVRRFFLDAQKLDLSTEVTRVEWRYL
jgi:hypothetical protein